MSLELVIHYPDADHALLRVEIAPNASDEQRAMCTAYWRFDEPGTWASAVKDIGAHRKVLATVDTCSKAYLLTVLCPTCRRPAEVGNRAIVAALRWGRKVLWSPGRPAQFPTEPLLLGRCDACKQGFSDAATSRLRRAAAVRYCDDSVHDFDVAVSARARLVAIRLSDIIGFEGRLEPLSTLDYSFLGDAEADRLAFEELWHGGWLALAPSSPPAAFSFDDEDAVEAIYITEACWILAPGLANNFTAPGQAPPSDLRGLLGGTDGLMGFERDGELTEEFRGIALDLRTAAAISYLNGVLTVKHRVHRIPDRRLDEAASHTRTALTAGLTLGQVLFLAWSAAGDAVSWAVQIDADVRAIAPSAAVTTFAKYVQGALNCAPRTIAAYTLPPQVRVPAVAPLVFSVVDEFDRAAAERLKIEEYGRLQEMLGSQRYCYHPDAGHDCPYCDGVDEHVHAQDPLPYEQVANADGPVDYALISPNGAVTFHHGWREHMQAAAGHGLGAERLWVDRVPRLRALVCALPGGPGCDCPRNTAADQLLALLGDGPATAVGPTVIFQVGHSQAENALVSLDRVHRDIVETALRAATPYFLHLPGEQ